MSNQADKPRLWTNPKDGSDFVYIPGGEFSMGSDRYSNERPSHRVRVAPFWIGLKEVTNAMFRHFVNSTNHAASGSLDMENFNDDEQPIVNVTDHDALAYCKWAGVRLPTESEWEFAARGTDGRQYPWGNEPPDPSRAVYDLRRANGYPALVGSKPDGASPFGVLDMAGNVLEWCSDFAGPYPHDAGKGPLVNPVGSTQGSQRIMRGSCLYYTAITLSTTERYFTLPNMKRTYCGFRTAGNLDRR